MSSVNVFVRQRPLENTQQGIIINTSEHKNGVTIVTKKDQNAQEREVTLDGFWGGNYSQQQVFETVGKPSCDKALSGFNATVICFGSTGSGKSYTIFGEGGLGFGNFGTDTQKLGLVPRMFDYLFAQAEQRTQYEFTFHVSFIELYLDQPYDLLVQRSNSRPGSRPGSAAGGRPGSATGRPSSATGTMSTTQTLQQLKEEETRQKLKIRQSIHGPFYADNLSVIQVKSSDEAMRALQAGYEQRTTKATTQNERSSRSHAIFTVAILQKSRSTGVATASLLSFVDLAGSENISKSDNSPERVAEGRVINTTLSALGNVVNALATGRSHVPYRDSKLTKLLQEALGGSSYTSIICNIWPLIEKDNETFQTLQFANRCRNVTNEPKVGVIDISGIEASQRAAAMLKEIEFLRNEKEKLETENMALKQELEELGARVEYVDESFINPLLRMSDESFERSLTGLSPKSREKRILERSLALEDYKNSGGKKSMRLYTEEQHDKRKQKDKEAKEREMAIASKEELYTLRMKVKRQAQDIFNLTQKLKENERDRRIETRELKDQLDMLRDTIRNNEVKYQMKIQSLQKLNKDELDQVLSAQDKLFKNQQQIIDSYVQKARPASALSDYRHTNDVNQELISRVEQSKKAEIRRLDDEYNSRLEKVKSAGEQSLLQKQQETEVLKQRISDLENALDFVYKNYRRAATIIAEAKEGKLDCYLLNEQELMQSYLNMDFNTSRQRMRAKAAVQVPPERDVKSLPADIARVVSSLRPERPQTGSNLSSFSSRPPSSMTKTIPQNFLQPHLKTGYNLSKPLNVTLNMDVHISPRPNGQAPVNKGQELHQKSLVRGRAVSATGSTIGSMGGTTRIVNRQYQQWGY